MIQIMFVIIACLALFGEITLIFLWYYGSIVTAKKNFVRYTPFVTIIVPCKGTTTSFQKNIEAICRQHYPSYNVLFILDSYDDPAYPILVDIQQKNPHVSLHLTKPQTTCSGKIAAQLTGIALANQNQTDVYVFADSDIQPHNTWLFYLVQPLQNSYVGATTGYRWYMPRSLTSYLISTWNMVLMVGLYYQITNYTWGGSTAITRSVFEQLKVADVWKNGLSDDLLLTERLKKNNYTIVFVPQSIAATYTNEKVGTFVRWANQQMTWMRWYYPSLWLFSLTMFAGLQLLTILGMYYLITGSPYIGLFLLTPLLFQFMYGYSGFITLRKQMKYPQKQLRSPIVPTLFTPLVFILITLNMALSGVNTKITWCGKTYKKSDFFRKTK